MAGSLFDEKSLDLESFGAARSKKTSVSKRCFSYNNFFSQNFHFTKN